MKISVLVAAYNGEKYIAQQLASILPQLGEGDEVLISDDSRTSKTKEACKPFLKDPRVTYLEGPHAGVDKNKEFLLRQCTGDAAFLSDQDDVWLPGKVKKVMAAIEGGACCVMHNARLTDDELNPIGETLFENKHVGTGLVRNVIRNGYTGCCMALTREAFEAALPFPEKLPMHDQWLGLVSERVGRVALIDEPLLLWRRNEGSMTGGRTSPLQKLLWRVEIVRALLRFRKS
ncbi:MAG: glycosyltransferase [Clostridia bacterium]|nr:glycosyltransferase [Clostridia bacterium]